MHLQFNAGDNEHTQEQEGSSIALTWLHSDVDQASLWFVFCRIRSSEFLPGQ